MSNLLHNEQAELAATFWNNLAVAVLFSVFLVPAFYTQHTMLQQALSIGGGLAAAIGLRMLSCGCGGCGNEAVGPTVTPSRNPRAVVPLRLLSCMRWPPPRDRARARCVGAPRR